MGSRDAGTVTLFTIPGEIERRSPVDRPRAGRKFACRLRVAVFRLRMDFTSRSMLRMTVLLGLRIERAFEKFSCASAAEEVVSLNHDAAAREHGVGHARHFNSFEHRIINAHVMR